MSINRFFCFALLLLFCSTQPAWALEVADASLFKFAGRLHVVVLHVPIGILLLGVFAACLRFVRLPVVDDKSLLTILICGSASALFAVVTGLMLAQEDGELSPDVQWHMYTGIAVLAVSLLNVFSLRRAIMNPVAANKFLFALSILGCAALVSWSGHLGGNLTHPKFIDKYAPWTPQKPKPVVAQPIIDEANKGDESNESVAMKNTEAAAESSAENIAADADADDGDDMQESSIDTKASNMDPMTSGMDAATESGNDVGVDAKIAQNVDLYQKHVEPLLAARCYECHGTAKRKGELRLDTPTQMLKGGKNGEVIVPGQPDRSSLYKLCILDPDDPDIMPSKGDALTKAETDLIQRWILGGAHFDKAAKVQAPVKSVDTRVSKIEAQSQGLGVADPAAIKKMKDADVQVNALSSNGALLELDMRYTKVDIATLSAAMKSIAKNVRWIDAGRSTLDDKRFAVLAQCQQLQRLYVHQTKITDVTLNAVAQMKDLEVLNFYKCAITDAGLDKLHALKKLQKIYLWETKVTDDGVERLQKALPQLDINRGN